MHLKVKFQEGFKDGTIFPKKPKGFAPGDEYVVTQQQLEQIQRSGGVVQVVEQAIPNPLKAQKEFDRLQALNNQGDPYNAENEINDVENHVPGTEDVIEEARALRELMRERREREARDAEKGVNPPLGLNDPEEREAQELRDEKAKEARAAELQKEVEERQHEQGQRGEAGENAPTQEQLAGTPGREALSDMLTEEQKDSIIPGEDPVEAPKAKRQQRKK